MDIGIATLAASSHTWFADATLYEGLPVLKKAGIKYLEYNDQTLPAYKDLPKAEAEEIRRRCDDLDLVLWSAHSPCLEGDLSAIDAAERRAAADLHLRCIERLGWLGVRNFVVHQVAGPWDQLPSKVGYGIESVVELCEAGAECGVRILIENFAPFGCFRVRDFAEQTGSRNIGIVFDIGHAHHTPVDEAEEITAWATCSSASTSMTTTGRAPGTSTYPPATGPSIGSRC